MAFHKSWIAQSLRLYCAEKLEGIDTVSDLRVFQLESLVMFEASKIKNSLLGHQPEDAKLLFPEYVPRYPGTLQQTQRGVMRYFKHLKEIG